MPSSPVSLPWCGVWGNSRIPGGLGQIAGTRELVIPGLPYLVIYRVHADQVEILRVFHTARDWPELMS